jgi:hypothetical protein
MRAIKLDRANRNGYNSLIRYPERKILFGGPGRRWEDNNKIDLEGTNVWARYKWLGIVVGFYC